MEHKFGKVLIGILVIVVALFAGKYIKENLLTANLVLNNDEPIVVDVGEEYSIEYEASKSSDFTLNWSSSDDNVVRVNQKGKISANKAGSAVVTAVSDNGMEASCDVIVSAKPIVCKNGQILKKPSGDCVASIKVEADLDTDCYVYMKSKETSSNDLGMYVKAGQIATTKAPLGTYNLYYVTGGTTWYGIDSLFGDKTTYLKSDKEITLYIDGNRVIGREFKLQPVANGNMPTEEIDSIEFPQ